MTAKTFLMTSIAGALLLGGISACATSADANKPRGIAAFKDDPALGEQVDRICFNRNIRGFGDTTDRTVVLTRGVRDQYIVEVSGACRDLKFAQSVGIDSRSSCITRGDYLLVSGSAFSLDDGTGLGPNRCLIQKMHKWDSKAKADDAETDNEDAPNP